MGMHFLTYKKATQSEKEMAVGMAEEVLTDFDAKRSSARETLDLASYADLPNLLSFASAMDGKSHLNNRGGEILEWYLSTQNEDGSFPVRPNATYSYTRVTGKILEALCRRRLSDGDAEFIKALKWLHSMQYTKEGSYFVKWELQETVLGGFRHDYHNANIWVDSTAHYLSALSFGHKNTL